MTPPAPPGTLPCCPLVLHVDGINDSMILSGLVGIRTTPLHQAAAKGLGHVEQPKVSRVLMWKFQHGGGR